MVRCFSCSTTFLSHQQFTQHSCAWIDFPGHETDQPEGFEQIDPYRDEGGEG